MDLLKGALTRKEFTEEYYYIYEEAYKYSTLTKEVFKDLLKYPQNDIKQLNIILIMIQLF